MKMDENDYLTVTNRVKISMAIHAIKDILPGFDGVTTDDGQKELLKVLYDWEEKLFTKINTDNG